MQLEEKLVENREAAHAESQQREDVLERGDEVLPEPVVEAVEDAGVKVRGELLGAIRMLLDGQDISISWLRLPERESAALEALQVATRGRGSLGELVYAEDRRDLLEQALAVLQPNLTRADDQSARELHAQFEDLTERVGELRHELLTLEDAQDELLEGQYREMAKEASEPSDKPKPKPKPSDPDAPRPATTLTGPDRPEPAPAPTTLVGPERREPASPPTTLTGPDRPEPPRPATSLTGPERAEPPPPATTLTGSDAQSGAPGEAEAAAKAKRPWWRPFG